MFLVLPLVITAFYFSNDWSRLPKILDFCGRGSYMAITSFASGLWTIYLLQKHAWSKRETDEEEIHQADAH